MAGKGKFGGFSSLKWGALPDLHDSRDLRLSLTGEAGLIHSAMGSRAGTYEILPTAAMAESLPSELDYSQKGMPLIENQGNFPWCTMFALTAILSRFYFFDLKLQGKPGQLIDLCEFWGYPEARKLAGMGPDSPEGVRPRDALELARTVGFLPQKAWSDLKEAPKEKDPQKLNQILRTFMLQLYASVDCSNLDEVKRALKHFGPLLATVYVYVNWQNTDGILEMPANNEAALGSHSIVICGYSEKKKAFFIRNSWGEKWALNGYAWMPYQLFLRSCYSLWSAVDIKGSKAIYPASDWQKLVDKWPQWLKDAVGIDY